LKDGDGSLENVDGGVPKFSHSVGYLFLNMATMRYAQLRNYVSFSELAVTFIRVAFSLCPNLPTENLYIPLEENGDVSFNHDGLAKWNSLYVTVKSVHTSRCTHLSIV